MSPNQFVSSARRRKEAVPSKIEGMLDRLESIKETVSDAKAKKQLATVIKQLRKLLQDVETERNKSLDMINQLRARFAELEAAVGAAQEGSKAEFNASPLAGSQSQATEGTSSSVTPLNLAASFKGVIEAIQSEARQTPGIATTVKSMDLEVKGLVQVLDDKNTMLVLPGINSGIDPNALSTLRVSFGAIPVAAPPPESFVPPTPTVTVPNVTQKPLSEATSILHNANLLVGNVTEQSVAGAAPGTVISQQPVAGTSVAPQTTVDLVLAKAIGTVTCPNLIGTPQKKAIEALNAAGLTVGQIQQEESSGPPDVVIRQNPPAGSQVAPGTAVNLVIATSAKTVIVPNLINELLDQARIVLTSAGLKLGRVQQAESSAPANTVIQQDPLPGDPAPPGSAVDLIVSLGGKPVTIPNLVGLTLAKATKRLETAGLHVGQVKKQPSTGTPGAVLRQTPVAETVVPAGSNVDLIVDER
jgi:beta-lactam-binding protein with PASTA domain